MLFCEARFRDAFGKLFEGKARRAVARFSFFSLLLYMCGRACTDSPSISPRGCLLSCLVLLASKVLPCIVPSQLRFSER